MTDWSERKLHFIAIGGAGMSGLALVCHQLGATVSGSDQSESSYVERLRRAGLEPRIGHDADAVPKDADVVVSTAISDQNPELEIARSRGQRVIHRGELLAELCAGRRLIAVSGTHGKTTTAAMLVWALRAAGADPAFFLGGELPGTGAGGEATNASWGAGEWVVAEADESDASFLQLSPEIAVVTNIELDHHSHWTSLGKLTEAFAAFSEPARAVIVGPGVEIAGEQAPERRLELRVPGRHNQLNALGAIAAAEHAGFDPKAAAASLAEFPGVARRFELKGTRAGARIYDDYAHHPTEVAATLEAARGLTQGRLLAAFQPHLYSRTKAFAAEFGAALAAADEVAVLDVYPAREQPVGELEGVSGLMVAAAAADRAGGRPVWWLPDAEQAAAALAPKLSDGDVLLTLGAGDIFRLAEMLVEEGVTELPDGVEADYPLARLTTVRIGGPADFYARPESEKALVELLAWAAGGEHAVAVVGSGSNLLVSDEGFRGLVLKLGGALTRFERQEDRLLSGGGARLPSAAAKAAGWGLTGLEFGVNIPGTVGGAVRMNANAYGGELARVLEWVTVCTAAGSDRRTPGELGFSYRNSSLGPGEVVSRACFVLRDADPDEVKATMAGMRERRLEAQPSGIKTFGSTFMNPEDAEGRTAGQLLDAVDARGLSSGAARFSEKHANFVENTGDATTADVLEVMAAGRRRVFERFGIALEPEVQLLGDVEWPTDWELGNRGGPDG